MKFNKLLEAYYLPKLSDKEEARLMNMLRKKSKKKPESELSAEYWKDYALRRLRH
jgi:hypothetical protein